jgi:oligosaccharide repeat unit polymerase
MKFGVKYAFLTEPYMYIVMNLENFSNAVARTSNYSYGYFSFNFVLSLTGLKHISKEYFQLVDFPFLNSSYNTYTQFFDFYRDFGIVGLSILSFTLAFISSNLYYRMLKRPNFNSIAIYAIFVFVMMFSFFLNSLGLLHFVFNIVIIYLVTSQIDRNTLSIRN